MQKNKIKNNQKEENSLAALLYLKVEGLKKIKRKGSPISCEKIVL